MVTASCGYGFISWIILCYFEHIEYHSIQKQTLEANRGDDTENFLGSNDYTLPILPESPVTSPPLSSTYHDTYESYINFFLRTFICLYVLAKIAFIAEDYITKRNMGTNYARMPDFEEEYRLKFLDMENAKNLREQQKTLLMQINSLEKQNLELKDQFKSETDDSNNQTINGIETYEEINRPGGGGGLPNIYVSNNHFHTNRHVFLKEEKLTMTFIKKSGGEKRDNNTDNIWKKYLDMQPKMTANGKSLTQTSLNQPVIISTADVFSNNTNNNTLLVTGGDKGLHYQVKV
uniref:Uncharacterized protein n=1 Tax=Glossina brevipalpis TaxID=37001 RepID=A0A1A9WXW4_9MUSC